MIRKGCKDPCPGCKDKRVECKVTCQRYIAVMDSSQFLSYAKDSRTKNERRCRNAGFRGKT